MAVDGGVLYMSQVHDRTKFMEETVAGGALQDAILLKGNPDTLNVSKLYSRGSLSGDAGGSLMNAGNFLYWSGSTWRVDQNDARNVVFLQKFDHDLEPQIDITEFLNTNSARQFANWFSWKRFAIYVRERLRKGYHPRRFFKMRKKPKFLAFSVTILGASDVFIHQVAFDNTRGKVWFFGTTPTAIAGVEKPASSKKEAFLAEMDPNTLSVIPGSARYYGGENDDEGLGMSLVNGVPCMVGAFVGWPRSELNFWANWASSMKDMAVWCDRVYVYLPMK
jgi:hypothetical protein